MQSDTQSINWVPFHSFGEDRPSRFLILCDHATNTVPGWLDDDLGLPSEDMARHIAYDVGAAGVALRLAEKLDAPAVMANFSRLVIDPNRGANDPTLIRRLYDETIIPANRHLDAAARTRRIEECYRPYHSQIAKLADRRPDTVIVSVHSFTPQLHHGAPRPWHAGVLFASDARLSMPLLDLLRAEGDLTVGENEPYSGYLPGDTLDQHATRKGRHNTIIEIRNDLISDDDGQAAWAERCARLLPQALARAENEGV